MVQPAPDKPPRRRRSAWRTLRTLGIALGATGLGTVVVFGIWLRTDDFQRRVSPLVRAAIEQQTGEQFTADRIDVRLWPPALELSDAALVHRDTGDTFLHVGSLRAPVLIGRRGIGLGTLRLAEVHAELHLDRGTGLRELRQMKRGGRPLRRLPFRNLDIRNSSVTLHLPDGKVALTELTATPDHASTDVSGVFALQFRDFTDRAAFDWQDLRIGPTEVHLPALALDFTALQLDGEATIGLDGQLAAALSAHSDLPQLDPLLGEPRALRGTAEVDVLLSGSAAQPQLELAAVVTDAGLSLPGAAVPVVHYNFGDLTLSADATRDGIEVSEARVCFRGLRRCSDPEQPDRIVARAQIDRELRLTDGELVAEGISLAHILRQMGAAPNPWTDFSGDAEVRFSGTLNPLLLEGPFDLAVGDWRVTSGPVDQPASPTTLFLPTATARGNLAIDKDHLSVDAIDVRGPRSRGSADVWLGFKPKGPLDLRAQLTRADLSDFAPLGAAELQGKGSVTGRLWGPFNQLQFDGGGDIRDFSVIGIDWADRLQARIASPDMKRIEILDASATVGQTAYTGSYVLGFSDPMWMDLDIDIPAGRVEDLVHLFLDLDGLRGDVSGNLDLSGPLYDLEGASHLALSEVDLFGERFERGSGHGYMDTGQFTLDDLRLERSDGSEGLILRGGVDRAWALDMELVGDGFQLGNLDSLSGAELPLTGRASVHAHIGNTLFDPAPRGRLALRDLRFDGSPIADSRVDFETNHGVMRFTGKLAGGTVATAGTLGLWKEQPYSISAALQRFPAHWAWPRGADGSPITALLTGSVDIDGHFGEEPSPVQLVADIREASVRWRDHHLQQTGHWHYEQRGDAFEATGIGLRGGQTELTLTEGRYGPDGLELRGEGQLDLDLLRAIVPGLERSDGLAQVGLEVSGRGRDVQTQVEVEVAGELFRHSSFPGSFEDVTARISANRDGFDLQDIQANLGGGIVRGGGRILARGWVPSRWDLTADARDVQLQWIDTLPPAIGNAQLSFDGPVDALLLSGEVQITDMPFTDRIDWEDWVVEYRDWVQVDYVSLEDEPWFDLDVHVVADNSITLRNNVAEGRASADLRFIGSTTTPGMQGRVQLSDTVAFLQDREFSVERGLLSWTDPWSWDPQLDFDLATDIRSRDTRYRVNYLVRGPFSDWRTETRSDPPLAQADINALLWFGATTDELEERGELPQALAQGVADFLLTDLFISQGRGGGDTIQVFDRVELVTGVDSRGEYNSDPRLLV